MYYSTYMEPVFVRDHREVLIEMAAEIGYMYNDKTQNFTPLLEANSPYLQQDHFLKNEDKLWIPALIFYIFSMLWLCSYFKLICTDIEFSKRPKFPEKLTDKQKYQLCKKCGVHARDDIYHCPECGCCNEYHDHHCDVVQVCVCSRNYKFFIQMMFHAGNIFLSVVISLVVLDGSYTNEKLSENYRVTNTVIEVISGIFFFIFIMCPLIFLCQTPLYEEGNEPQTMKQLRIEY